MQPQEYDFHGFLHSATLVEDKLRRQLSPLGINPRQARVLMAMKHMAPVSQVALADACGITPASMSTMTDRLLAAGYITRSPDAATRRRNAIDLTNEGRAKLDEISKVWDAVDNVLREALGGERAQLGGKPPGHR